MPITARQVRRNQFVEQQVVATVRKAKSGTAVGAGVPWAACHKLGAAHLRHLREVKYRAIASRFRVISTIPRLYVRVRVKGG